ncbi:hypothetical protein KIW_00728 [Pediococcus acidilactici MA18/5M]|nr:hypothetical protein KIW_00728 [Pediococcus acidilactici MA18/5M]
MAIKIQERRVRVMLIRVKITEVVGKNPVRGPPGSSV